MLDFFKEYKVAQDVVKKKYHIIFYVENAYYYQYLHHLFSSFSATRKFKICYITSQKNDPILNEKIEGLEAVYLKSTLAFVFSKLQADVMIMTMPDLENFILKRSKEVKKYVYVFHALVSSHQQYREFAFDNYDAVFCTGEQQEKEIRVTEKIYELPQKELIQYGYPLLEELKIKAIESSIKNDKILVAPTWYAEGILSTCILLVIEALLPTRKDIFIRPHPEFLKRNKKDFKKLEKLSHSSSNVIIDTSPSIFNHLLDAAYLITDRSGIAFEYAFAIQRPVIFIDTPPKIQNKNFKKISITPMEDFYRDKIGKVVAVNEISKLSDVIDHIDENISSITLSIQEAENEMLYPAAAKNNGVEYINKIIS